MNDVTRILGEIDQGNAQATGQLLPLVYAELRRIADEKLAREKPGQTLQATALVHEAYLRLVDTAQSPQWNGRGHFFAAAAEAMRRILVENARRKGRIKHGGLHHRVELNEDGPAVADPDDQILAVDEALEHLSKVDATAAQVVKLHFFGGLTLDQTAELLGMSPRTTYRNWAYARAWLHRRLSDDVVS